MTWLLCDYGEVLSLAQSPSDLAAIEQAAGRSGDAFWGDYWLHRPAYDRADLGVADYWGRVLGVAAVDPDQQRRLIQLDAASWLHPNPLSLAAASAAGARGLRLAILSNAPFEVADAIDAADWLAGFSPRLFSCRLGAIKPEPAAFGGALDALHAKPQEVIFFDDRPANVEAASALGLRSHLFKEPQQLADVVP
jgi:putative hydrolase of the HAD superfamily